MEINIVSTEIIKPSSPTPPHLRTHKLSGIDQVSTDCFFQFILFFSGEANSPIKSSGVLKQSLSKALTRYYPLAGRVKDEVSVDCDDYGVAFVEARVAGELSDILKQPNDGFLLKLVPFKLNNKPDLPVSLIIQTTYFSCGSMAICAGFSHTIADISTAANFIKCWASIACGSNIYNGTADAISDCTSFFPQQNLSGFSKSSFYRAYFEPTENITKRFIFDGEKIAALRDKRRDESSSGYRPTRFEAVSSLILGGLMTAAREEDEFNYRYLVARTPVNLRSKMNPPLPELSIGNIVQLTTANWPIEKTVDYNKLIEKLHESIVLINDEYVRKVHAGGYLNYMKSSMEGPSTDVNSIKNITITSWMRLPFYQVDFGWGKPTRVVSLTNSNDIAMLLDTPDEKGIEALVGLSKKEMAKFEQDPGILAYASTGTGLL
ncbi:Vinorine synthase [Melia azedarach]|uniref:Vinorine synthase n=1 Tax=Melia azedarach TaxID=155640 RepID=A0ACC1YEW2_MELAZ|nr:Vinorine synthase [Melia azedarach]